MGRRSNFKRRPQDAYNTIDQRAVERLLPHLNGTKTFAEPCAGRGDLVRQLESAGLRCVHATDISEGVDALKLTLFGGADTIITNPPWSREVLHPMILHFQAVAPTWLLFDCDWAYNKQAGPFLDQCSDIVAVGRLKWIEGSKASGKDNSAWFRFDALHSGGPHFHGRS
jgi:hypothetical protein